MTPFALGTASGGTSHLDDRLSDTDTAGTDKGRAAATTRVRLGGRDRGDEGGRFGSGGTGGGAGGGAGGGSSTVGGGGGGIRGGAGRGDVGGFFIARGDVGMAGDEGGSEGGGGGGVGGGGVSGGGVPGAPGDGVLGRRSALGDVAATLDSRITGAASRSI